MEDLFQGDRLMTTDMEKAQALSSIFVLDMPILETEDQRAIDVLRRMHCPPRAMDEFGIPIRGDFRNL